MSNELNPCPFCAAAPLMQEHEPHTHSIGLGLPDHTGSFTIECPTDGCCGLIADTKPEAIAAWNRRAAPAVANGAAELPPLPVPEFREEQSWKGTAFTAEQMHTYARAAIAASTKQAAPKQALTDAYILAQWEITREEGGFIAMMIPSDKSILAYARAIEAAASPNALLAVALKDIIEMNRQTAEDQYGDANKAESWCCVKTARAALASVPTAPEA